MNIKEKIILANSLLNYTLIEGKTFDAKSAVGSIVCGALISESTEAIFLYLTGDSIVTDVNDPIRWVKGYHQIGNLVGAFRQVEYSDIDVYMSPFCPLLKQKLKEIKNK